jgi:hypothetical protein
MPKTTPILLIAAIAIQFATLGVALADKKKNDQTPSESVHFNYTSPQVEYTSQRTGAPTKPHFVRLTKAQVAAVCGAGVSQCERPCGDHVCGFTCGAKGCSGQCSTCASMQSALSGVLKAVADGLKKVGQSQREVPTGGSRPGLIANGTVQSDVNPQKRVTGVSGNGQSGLSSSALTSPGLLGGGSGGAAGSGGVKSRQQPVSTTAH